MSLLHWKISYNSECKLIWREPIYRETDPNIILVSSFFLVFLLMGMPWRNIILTFHWKVHCMNYLNVWDLYKKQHPKYHETVLCYRGVMDSQNNRTQENLRDLMVPMRQLTTLSSCEPVCFWYKTKSSIGPKTLKH